MSPHRSSFCERWCGGRIVTIDDLPDRLQLREGLPFEEPTQLPVGCGRDLHLVDEPAVEVIVVKNGMHLETGHRQERIRSTDSLADDERCAHVIRGDHLQAHIPHITRVSKLSITIRITRRTERRRQDPSIQRVTPRDASFLDLGDELDQIQFV